jgi:hypothetical protein
VTDRPGLTTITTAGQPAPGWRQRECGCWERHLHGDIDTHEVEVWVTTAPCPTHQPPDATQAHPYQGIRRAAAEALARYHRRMLAAADAEIAKYPPPPG